VITSDACGDRRAASLARNRADIGYTLTTIEERKQIQAKIDALEDEARKNGVEPGQLR
jgi:hypothetical protein